MYWLDIAPGSIESGAAASMRRSSLAAEGGERAENPTVANRTRILGPSVGVSIRTAADHSQYAAVDRRDHFGAAPQRDGDHAPSRGARAPGDGAGDDVPAHARRRPARSPSCCRRRAPITSPPLIERLDGICLSGGPDLDPNAYGAPERHLELGPTEPSLDAFELALTRLALERSLPILAVCRGAQALNVACGGTLHQHIPGHRQTDARDARPRTTSRSPPARACTASSGPATCRVNSFHHQAVDKVGDGLEVVGRAPDGTIEAIEGPGFIVGVQWHAETLHAHLPLFEALVSAAARTELRIAA